MSDIAIMLYIYMTYQIPIVIACMSCAGDESVDRCMSDFLPENAGKYQIFYFCPDESL